ncbi:Nucleoporin Nup43 [Acipenser ruthenus]|uniref:Nucleoporin Nup43 n=1 Tax=Acipenser ruthenus TaxID=7906 RepID=A0A662YRN4_ACIRT|nr:Nucleoporin Nup43 [Acipenser ruthenus]
MDLGYPQDNTVSIWSVAEQAVQDKYEGDPQLLCEYKHDGDVMDLQFMDQERIITASSTGSVTIFRHYPNSQDWRQSAPALCRQAPKSTAHCGNRGSGWHAVRQGNIPYSVMEAYSAESGRNTTIPSRSTVAPASINQSLISSWLTSDSSEGRLETTSMLPSQTMSSLDVPGASVKKDQCAFFFFFFFNK